MSTFVYDDRFDPPAPVVNILVRLAGSDDRLQLTGIVDTGADLTLVPEDVAQNRLPVAGTVDIRGVTGDVAQAVLYRAEIGVGAGWHHAVVAGFGFETIVGRDLLKHVVLTLDGPAGELTIASP